VQCNFQQSNFQLSAEQLSISRSSEAQASTSQRGPGWAGVEATPSNRTHDSVLLHIHPAATMSKNISMYHYTNAAGMKGITAAGHINMSTDTRSDCLRGVGVYGTTMTPSAGGAKIAANTAARADPTHYIKFRVPANQVDQYQGHSSGGQHLVHRAPMDARYLTKVGKVKK